LKANGDLDLSAITPYVFQRTGQQSNLRQIPDTDNA
jgi:hypothetical protein